MPNNSAGPGLVILGRPQDDHRPAWRTVNITPTERLGRIAVGLAAVIAGIVLLTGAGPAVAVALELLQHIGLLAGTALVAGAAGTALFGILGLALSVPMLLRLRRRFASWWAPAIGLAVFVVMFSGIRVRHRPRPQRRHQRPAERRAAHTLHQPQRPRQLSGEGDVAGPLRCPGRRTVVRAAVAAASRPQRVTNGPDMDAAGAVDR
jgi:hypothetical protein